MSRSHAALVPTHDAPRLSARQQRAATLLATGWTGERTAKEIGVRRETISRWRRNPSFLAALDAARAEVWQANVVQLQALATKALSTISSAMGSGDPRLALRAAELVIETSGLAAAASSTAISPADVTALAAIETAAVAVPPADPIAQTAIALIAESRAIRLAIASKYTEHRSPPDRGRRGVASPAEAWDLPLPPE